MLVGKLVGIPPISRKYMDSEALALGRCLTGVEFECENVQDPNLPADEDWTYAWKKEPDGSLRNLGMEYILKEPLFGVDLVNALKGFCEFAKSRKFEANYRTGLHIHIDVRNLNASQLLSLIVHYVLFEKVIFRLVGNGREGSNFCMPFYRAEGSVKLVSQMFVNNSAKMREASSQIDRYSALNLNALSKYGSFEWRHFQTTFDFFEVLQWINLAQGFKKYAKTHQMAPGEILAEVSKKGAKAIFEEIVGPELARRAWYPEAEVDIWNVCMPIANDLTYLTDNQKYAEGWDQARFKNAESPHFKKWADSLPAKDREAVNQFIDPRFKTDEAYRQQVLESMTAEVHRLLSEYTFN